MKVVLAKSILSSQMTNNK